MANPNGTIANLRPWGPDNPPPKSPGAPRKRPLSEAYEDWLREDVTPQKLLELQKDGVIPRTTKHLSNADMVAIAQGRQAIRGNVAAAKEMREAVEGKATQRIELIGNEQRAPELVIVYANGIPGERTALEIIERVPKELEDIVRNPSTEEIVAIVTADEAKEE